MFGLLRRGVWQKSSTGFKSAPITAAIESLEPRTLFAVAIPTGLTATAISATAITLHWNASTDNSVVGYDVFNKYWVKGTGGPKGSHTGGHYVTAMIASDIKTTSDAISGLISGNAYTYLISAVGADGSTSLQTDPVSVETWLAPSLSYGSAVLLSSGALFSSPISATVGMTTEFTLLASGNPINWSLLSGPSNIKVDPRLGLVSFRPLATQVGSVTAKFKGANALGLVTQSVTFHVASQSKALLIPKLSLANTSHVYSSFASGVSASAFAADGKTPIAGTWQLAYNGGPGTPTAAGSYRVLATFTSANAAYANATITGTFKITKATPVFSSITDQSLAVGTSSALLSGHIGSGFAVPSGERVILTVNGTMQAATVDANGSFSTSFAIGSLGVGTYTIAYSYGGGTNFNAAASVSSKLAIVPLVAPKVTLNPRSVTVTAGDSATFTAAATGVNPPTVQWQASSDGGNSFTNIYSPYGDTLIVTASTANDGYLYRAIFTNAAGSAATTWAKLTVEQDSGGGN